MSLLYCICKYEFMKITRPVALLLGALMAAPLMFTGCRKYPDGPTISLLSREERVSNNWTAASIFRNNIDETTQWEVYDISFTKSGQFTWTIKPDGAPGLTLNGTWELATVDEQIRLEYTDPSANETRLLFMDLLKLQEEEMWVGFISEGDEYDLKLFP